MPAAGPPSRSGPAAGGGRWVTVAPDRLSRWIDGFAERHGSLHVTGTREEVVLTALDGSVATCLVPFPPLAQDRGDHVPALVAHALTERTVGVLLVRLGGFAAGVFRGDRLEASRCGSRQVHGRAAAGGWSQQRFARRREGQARVALAAATGAAVDVLLPSAPGLDAVVAGGDRAAVTAVLADPRLSPLRARLVPGVLEVAEPRRAVLKASPELFLAVRIRITERPPGPATAPART